MEAIIWLWPEIEHTPTLPFKAGIVQATLAWKGPFFFQSFETNNAVKGPHSTTARASRASRCVGQRAFAGSTHKELLALLHKANHGADKGPRGQFQWWTKTHAFFFAASAQENRKPKSSNGSTSFEPTAEVWFQMLLLVPPESSTQGAQTRTKAISVHLLWR